MNNDTVFPNAARTCGCGFKRGDDLIQPKAHYSWGAWVLMVIGISSCPEKIDFACIKCGEILESVTDKNLCDSYRYNL